MKNKRYDLVKSYDSERLIDLVNQKLEELGPGWEPGALVIKRSANLSWESDLYIQVLFKRE